MMPLFLSLVLASAQTAEPLPQNAPQTAALPQAAPLAQRPAPLTYRFDKVRHTVHLLPKGEPKRQTRITRGSTAESGDQVRTGWFSQVMLSVPERNARFEVYANSQVQLAGGEPGVLMVVDRGRVKAFFEKLVNGEQTERRIAVPGALLAVRGTRYGVDVDSQGKSTLVVFDGVVEVIGKSPSMAPFRVRAGEWSTFGFDAQPKVQPIPTRNFGEQSWNKGTRPDGSTLTQPLPGPMAPGGFIPKEPPHQGPFGHH